MVALAGLLVTCIFLAARGQDPAPAPEGRAGSGLGSRPGSGLGDGAEGVPGGGAATGKRRGRLPGEKVPPGDSGSVGGGSVGGGSAGEKPLPGKGPPGKAGSQAQNRQRWAGLSPEKRKEIQRLYEELRKLTPRERELLLERLKSLEPARRREVLRTARERMAGEHPRKEAEGDDFDAERMSLLRDLFRKRLEGLPLEEREKLKNMSPDERRSYAQKKALEIREKAISQLPPRLRERLQASSPAEQLRFLRRYHGDRFLKQTFPDPAEVEALRRLPPEELRVILRPARRGKPPSRPDFISEASWKRWTELEPVGRELVLQSILGRPGEPAQPGKGASRDGSQGPGQK